jgi:LysM repeat protein
VVEKGDNLSAKENNVSVQNLKDWNNLARQ